jgi:hypothetical protein
MDRTQSVSLLVGAIVGTAGLVGMLVVLWVVALFTGVVGHAWAPAWWRSTFFALALVAAPGVASWLGVAARRKYLRPR